MKFKFSLLFFLFLGFTLTSFAQNISNIDFKTVNVDNLTEQQIQQIKTEAKSRGLDADQIAQLAIQQGMPRTEALKLRNRLNQSGLSLSSGNNQLTSDSSRLRYSPSDSSHDQHPGVDSSGGSGSIASIQYKSRRDSITLAHQKLKDKIFGFGLFTNKATSFEPSLNIPTPKNYQLGPGDEILIDIYGAAEKTYQLEVSPDGMVIINNLGPIPINGLTIEEAKKRLLKRLGNIYSGLNPVNDAEQNTFMQISLGQIRSIKVSVIGEAAKPGTYTLPSLATVFNALYSAGGPTITGSFRDIDIIRGDSVISTFDLYDLLIDGNQKNNIRLNDQDIIKINPYINRVDIEGEVKRPGIYEMKKGETLDKLLTFAGRFTGNAYTNRIKIVGNTNRQRRINDVSKKNFNHFKLTNGDVIKVAKVLDRFKNVVEIKGAVFREGKYQLTDTTTVYSLIKQADGLRGDAFQNRGLIYRQQPDYTLKTLRFNVQKVVDNPGEYDIALNKNDLVVISSIFDLRDDYFIQVEGAVQDPGKYKYAKDMTLQDLIFRANGFAKDATPYRIEVARRVNNKKENLRSSQIANIFHFKVNKDLSLNPSEADFQLQPFDKVYIRKSPNYEKQKEVEVTGQIQYPGTYTLKTKKDRISDLIKRAGGITRDAYTDGATLYRKLPALQEKQNRKEGLYTQNIDSLRKAQRQPKKVTISKIGINLPRILKNPGSKYDLYIQKSDSLYIPKRLQTVIVKGGVFYPTSIRYDKKMTYRDYITAAGGYNELAKDNNSYIVYANGDVNRVKKFLFFKNYPEVKPGATLVVPERQKVKKISTQERVGIYSAIVSTLAVISTTIFQIAR